MLLDLLLDLVDFLIRVDVLFQLVDTPLLDNSCFFFPLCLFLSCAYFLFNLLLKLILPKRLLLFLSIDICRFIFWNRLRLSFLLWDCWS
jgi:hypothetical protein